MERQGNGAAGLCDPGQPSRLCSPLPTETKRTVSAEDGSAQRRHRAHTHRHGLQRLGARSNPIPTLQPTRNMVRSYLHLTWSVHAGLPLFCGVSRVVPAPPLRRSARALAGALHGYAELRGGGSSPRSRPGRSHLLGDCGYCCCCWRWRPWPVVAGGPRGPLVARAAVAGPGDRCPRPEPLLPRGRGGGGAEGEEVRDMSAAGAGRGGGKGSVTEACLAMSG